MRVLRALEAPPGIAHPPEVPLGAACPSTAAMFWAHVRSASAGGRPGPSSSSWGARSDDPGRRRSLRTSCEAARWRSLFTRVMRTLCVSQDCKCRRARATGETPERAVLREAHEETGLPGLRIVRHLGDADYDMRPYADSCTIGTGGSRRPRLRW